MPFDFLRLRRLVERHPCINNTNHSNFNNDNITKETWKKIGEEMHQRPEECRTMWMILNMKHRTINGQQENVSPPAEKGTSSSETSFSPLVKSRQESAPLSPSIMSPSRTSSKGPTMKTQQGSVSVHDPRMTSSKAPVNPPSVNNLVGSVPLYSAKMISSSKVCSSNSPEMEIPHGSVSDPAQTITSSETSSFKHAPLMNKQEPIPVPLPKGAFPSTSSSSVCQSMTMQPESTSTRKNGSDVAKTTSNLPFTAKSQPDSLSSLQDTTSWIKTLTCEGLLLNNEQNSASTSLSRTSVNESFNYLRYPKYDGGEFILTSSMKTNFPGEQCTQNQQNSAPVLRKWTTLGDISSFDPFPVNTQLESPARQNSTSVCGNPIGSRYPIIRKQRSTPALSSLCKPSIYAGIPLVNNCQISTSSKEDTFTSLNLARHFESCTSESERLTTPILEEKAQLNSPAAQQHRSKPILDQSVPIGLSPSYNTTKMSEKANMPNPLRKTSHSAISVSSVPRESTCENKITTDETAATNPPAMKVQHNSVSSIPIETSTSETSPFHGLPKSGISLRDISYFDPFPVNIQRESPTTRKKGTSICETSLINRSPVMSKHKSTTALSSLRESSQSVGFPLINYRKNFSDSNEEKFTSSKVTRKFDSSAVKCKRQIPPILEESARLDSPYANQQHKSKLNTEGKVPIEPSLPYSNAKMSEPKCTPDAPEKASYSENSVERNQQKSILRKTILTSQSTVYNPPPVKIQHESVRSVQSKTFLSETSPCHGLPKKHDGVHSSSSLRRTSLNVAFFYERVSPKDRRKSDSELPSIRSFHSHKMNQQQTSGSVRRKRTSYDNFPVYVESPSTCQKWTSVCEVCKGSIKPAPSVSKHKSKPALYSLRETSFSDHSHAVNNRPKSSVSPQERVSGYGTSRSVGIRAFKNQQQTAPILESKARPITPPDKLQEETKPNPQKTVSREPALPTSVTLRTTRRERTSVTRKTTCGSGTKSTKNQHKPEVASQEGTIPSEHSLHTVNDSVCSEAAGPETAKGNRRFSSISDQLDNKRTDARILRPIAWFIPFNTHEELEYQDENVPHFFLKQSVCLKK